MLEEIKETDLLIAPIHIKNKILKEASEQNIILKFKCMTLEEVKRKIFETADEKSLYYLMKNYDLNYDIAKEYLNYIFLKHPKITKYYEALKEELLIKSNFNYKNVTIIGYDNIEPYMLNELNKYNLKIINENKTENYNPKIYEFETQTDEITFLAHKIIKDLKDKNINDMYVIIPSKEYMIELDRIFKLFNIPVNMNDDSPIYSTKTAKMFIEKLEETKDINIALENIPKNEIYNEIINILNKYNFIEDIDKTYIEIIKKELHNKKIRKNKLEKAINIIDINEIYDKSKNYYILGLNQNILPKIYEESDIFNEKEKKSLGLFTASEKNKIEKNRIKNILTHFPNIYVSYKLKDNLNTYYPASIINDLNLEIVTDNKIELDQSNKYNKLLLASLLDKYINYNEEDERIKYLFSTYKELNYNTYNNEYKKISENKIKKYLNNELTLSYSSMNNYFLCPFKFYIQNILRINKKEETFPIIIGNLFHYVLQNLYTPNFELDTLYTEYIKNIELSPKEKHYIKKLEEVLKEDIKVIKMQDNKTEFKNKLTEKKIIIEKNKDMKISFIGVIDKISMLDDYIIITDYKTGNNMATLNNITDGLNMQLPVYIYLIKNGFEKDKKIAGFYLQKLINNKKVDDKENITENLKLNGYTINDEKIIEKIDHTYENSEVIKSMKKTKNGFYSYTKLISEKEINLIEKITDENINKVINAVERSDFKINPKRLKNELISCEFCKFKDLCFYKEEDITTLKEKTFEEIVGDINA